MHHKRARSDRRQCYNGEGSHSRSRDHASHASQISHARISMLGARRGVAGQKKGAARRLASIRSLPKIHDTPARSCGPGCTRVLLRPKNQCGQCDMSRFGVAAPRPSYQAPYPGPAGSGDLSSEFCLYSDILCAKWTEWIKYTGWSARECA